METEWMCDFDKKLGQWRARMCSQCRLNVGPPSSTLAQHWADIGSVCSGKLAVLARLSCPNFIDAFYIIVIITHLICAWTKTNQQKSPTDVRNPRPDVKHRLRPPLSNLGNRSKSDYAHRWSTLGIKNSFTCQKDWIIILCIIVLRTSPGL